MDVKCPIFLIHGNKDRVIPYKFSVRLEKLNPRRIRLFTIKGAKHNNLPKFEEYHRWLDYALNDPDAILSDK